MSLKIEMFPPALIALNREVTNHPKLMKRLAEQPSGDWEIRLATICTYCGFLVDGEFDKAEINHIADSCMKILIERRSSIILPL